ncbi:hypothetical protein ACFLQ7_00350, partial [Actinomycetota bacterium]
EARTTTTEAGDTAWSEASLDVGRGLVPPEVVALIDQWQRATDSSIVDLYTATGYHLYGAERFEGEGIAAHLTGPSALNVGHEAMTPLLLVADGPGRWVVTQGVENSVGALKVRSAVYWVVMEEVPSRELKIAQSAWLKVGG